MANKTIVRYNSLDNVTINHAEAIATDWVNKSTEKYSDYDDGYYGRWVEKTREAPKVRSKFIYDTLKALSVNDSDSKFLMKVINKREGTRILRNDKIKGLIKKYLLEPCKMYVKTLDIDSFRNTFDFTNRWYVHNCDDYKKFKRLMENSDNCERFIILSEKGEDLYSGIYTIIGELASRENIIEP